MWINFYVAIDLFLLCVLRVAALGLTVYYHVNSCRSGQKDKSLSFKDLYFVCMIFCLLNIHYVGTWFLEAKRVLNPHRTGVSVVSYLVLTAES